MIFETERLVIRSLKESDRALFFDMMRNPNVMDPIPRPVMDKAESDANFEKHLNAPSTRRMKVWGVDTKQGDQFIGLVAFLINDNDEDEIGYRLREQFWGIGYGTEVTKGMINYGFNTLDFELLTADVNTANENSVKILDKYFIRDHEFYNEEDQCTDRRYKLKKADWS